MQISAGRLKGVCIGAGNVASTLSVALSKRVDFIQVFSRDINNANSLASKLKCAATDSLQAIADDAAFYLLSVSDDGLVEITDILRHTGKAIWAHTSGSVPADVLSRLSPHYGVFYPLQTFTKNREINLGEVPFFIEGSDSLTERFLTELAGSISHNVHYADSPVRETIHIAGVMSCNFTTALLGLTQDILAREGLELNVIEPLVKETISKVFATSPHKAMTGPARRGDRGVIQKHLSKLTSPEREVYQMLTDIIIEQFRDK